MGSCGDIAIFANKKVGGGCHSESAPLDCPFNGGRLSNVQTRSRSDFVRAGRRDGPRERSKSRSRPDHQEWRAARRDLGNPTAVQRREQGRPAHGTRNRAHPVICGRDECEPLAPDHSFSGAFAGAQGRQSRYGALRPIDHTGACSRLRLRRALCLVGKVRSHGQPYARQHEEAARFGQAVLHARGARGLDESGICRARRPASEARNHAELR